MPGGLALPTRLTLRHTTDTNQLNASRAMGMIQRYIDWAPQPRFHSVRASSSNNPYWKRYYWRPSRLIVLLLPPSGTYRYHQSVLARTKYRRRSPGKHNSEVHG